MVKAVVAMLVMGIGAVLPQPQPQHQSLPGNRDGQVASHAGGRYVNVNASRSSRQEAEEASASARGSSGRQWRSVHAFGCARGTGGTAPDIDGLCAGDGSHMMPGFSMCDESEWLPPRWRSYLDPGMADWSAWEQVDAGSCPQDRVPALTVEDFRQLPLPAPVLRMQPDRGWVLVNAETIVWTDPAPVVLEADLLGFAVQVEATPSRFTYDFGDGSEPLVTRDPGHEWPDFTTHHVYGQLSDGVAITLTTTWTGRYRLVGSELWLDVAGTAQTSTTGGSFRVEERTSRLVSGLCTDRPKPPDC